MTATAAGNVSCPPAKGLDISLAALQRQDPYINNIVDVASQVALYTYNNRANEWEKTDVEGTLFIYTRLASPRHGFTIMNRLSMKNLTEPITKDLDFQLQHPFLLYRNARLIIHGIWFYDKEDCQRIAQRMKILTQQEQTLAQARGGLFSPGEQGRGGGGGGNEAKPVDIIQMLTKARTEYDKSTSEPKEIGGSSVLSGNPNLIKPIPVKPNTQDGEAAEPKPLSLATLFGSQNQHLPQIDPISPLATPLDGSSVGKVTRPPVARTLIYEDAVNSARGGNRGQTSGAGGQNVAVGLMLSPTAAHQQNPPQHCPAIQKLLQGQRGTGSVVGVLHPVSESPENRLCDNGMPLDHHHHHHMLHHHQQHHHHHHHHHQEQQLQQQLQQQQQQQQQLQQQQQQQQQLDPIQRLFQNQPLPPSSSTPLCCSPLQQNPSLSSRPPAADSQPCSHFQAQQSQQLFFNKSKAQPEAQHSSQSASAPQGPGSGQTSQMPGVVSPHELLLKLQLVQHEQSLDSPNPPRPSPGLAPRFLGPTQVQGLGSAPNLTPAPAGQAAALQYQVVSPQRIPATVAPNLLLSPSVFTQAKSSGGLTAVAKEICPAPSTVSRPLLPEETRVLSRSQLQAALLNLIQTDGSFLDVIYEAYVSRLSNSSSSNF